MTTPRLSVLQVGKFYPPYRGGMETHLHTLCTGLREHVDLRVLVANDGRQRVDEVMDGIPVTRLGTKLNFASAPITPGLTAVMRAANPDIIHLHIPHPTAVLSYLASRHRGRLIVTYHSDIVRQRVLGQAFRPVLDRFLSRSSAIICGFPNYIDSSPVLRMYRERCQVLPYGITTEHFEIPDEAAVRAIRARHGDRIVLAVGRHVGYKGFEYLVRAMAGVDARLIVVGDGPLRGSLEDMSRALGLEAKVAFAARVEDVTPYYHAADVFVLPSVARSEAFGLVQLEAMAAGLPVVNTSLASGVPYVSPHGITGLTVPPKDERALADAITRLLDDPELRQRYGAAARHRVHTDFTVDEMVRQTLAIYEAAMSVEPGVPIRLTAHRRGVRGETNAVDSSPPQR